MARPELFQSAYTGFSDTSGNPLSGGKVYTYDAGTTSARGTWQNPSKTLSHANPVVLDSNGRAEIWAEGNYKFELRTAAEVLIDTIDNVYLNRDDLTGLHAGTSTGAAGVYAITLAPPLLTYAAGQIVSFVANHTNPGNSTININSIGARTVLLQGLAQIFPGAIQNGGLYYLAINATTATLLNPHRGTFTYTPTLTPSSGGTLSAIAHVTQYTFSGSYCTLQVNESFTVNTATIPRVRCTLPVPIVGGTGFLNGTCLVNIGAGDRAGITTPFDTNNFETANYDAAAYTVGAGRYFVATITYRWI